MNCKKEMQPTLSITIGIATAGRRELIPLTLLQLSKLNSLPSKVIICPASEQDIDLGCLSSLPFESLIVQGERGLTKQRNAILDAAGQEGLIFFIDDDFYPADDYLEQLQRAFQMVENLVCATNQPLADGATGPGYTHHQALSIIAASTPITHARASPTYGGYGCNMTFRLDVIQKHQLRFDGALPLYGWLEDIDFSRRIAPHGAIMNWSGLRGVHLATKNGRTSGVRIGYSQIANPYYMYRKGTLTASYAFKHMVRNMAKNLLRFIWQEPWVDRRGRLKGNVLACWDVLTGQAAPERILKL